MLKIINGRVVDPLRQFDGPADLWIEGGRIIEIVKRGGGEENTPSPPGTEPCDDVIDASGLIVAPGLVDVHVHFRDPGFTYKEDIESGAAAAAAGGFTTVVCMANTKPPIDNIETLEYVLEKGKKTGIHVLASAAVTKGLKGQELTDMEALRRHGAAGFTDDGIPLLDVRLVKKAMETAAALDVPLSFHEEDPALIETNGINQGEVSKALGLGGSPAVAEDSLVARDCMLALHTKAAVNIQHLSSANAVRMVALAKSLGAHVWAEVTPHHFTLDETAVLEHRTLAKMNPPLRTARDREALIAGLKDGTIDIIATDHAPHSAQEKQRQFDQAPSGIIGLETALSLAVTNLVRPGHLSYVELFQRMCLNPARLYRLDAGSIEKGKAADLVIFDENRAVVPGNYRSKSTNSPFTGQKLYGQVRYTICGGRVVFEGGLA